MDHFLGMESANDYLWSRTHQAPVAPPGARAFDGEFVGLFPFGLNVGHDVLDVGDRWISIKHSTSGAQDKVVHSITTKAAIFVPEEQPGLAHELLRLMNRTPAMA